MRTYCLMIVFVLSGAGVALGQTRELILPVVVNGYVQAPLHYQTTFRIWNLSSAPAEVTLEAFNNSGAAVRILELFPIARAGTTTVFRLEPLGSAEAATYGDVPSFNGWARLTYPSSAAIQATAEIALIDAPPMPHPICHRPSSEIVATALIPGMAAAMKFSGVAVIRPYRAGGYALVNPSASTAATVFVSLLDLSGKLVAASTIELGPQQRTSQYLSEMLPGAPSDFMGSLRITGTATVAAGSLNVLLPEVKFSSVSVNALEPLACAQVIVAARNPLTGECRVFPMPCVVPDGWLIVSSCK